MCLSHCFFSVLICSILLLNCASPIDVEKEAGLLLQADQDFATLSTEVGAPEAFYRFLAEDAMQFPAGADPIVGRAAIRNSMMNGPELTLSWEPQKAEVSRSGDMGWTWGTYKASWQDDEKNERVSYGKYVNVWKKQADGSWKVIADIGNTSPAPN